MILEPLKPKIMAIISSILPPFDFFVSTFYSTRDALLRNYKIVYFEFSYEHLTFGKYNILHMSVLNID